LTEAFIEGWLFPPLPEGDKKRHEESCERRHDEDLLGGHWNACRGGARLQPAF
jgi:hypothetical protein